MALVQLLFITVIYFLLYMVKSEFRTCDGGNFVCTTLMQYKDGYTADEGPNCECPNCHKTWNETDRMSLTWHHYENSDRLVQYRFCTTVIPNKICERLQQVAAVMETDVDSWNIHIDTVHCQCPGGIFYMYGWWRKEGRWVYKYICYLPTCEESETCSRTYKDDKGSKLGYRFQCVCGDDSVCNTNPDKSSRELVDQYGSYVSGKCRKFRNRK